MARIAIQSAMWLIAFSILTGCAQKKLDYTPSPAVAEADHVRGAVFDRGGGRVQWW